MDTQMLHRSHIPSWSSSWSSSANVYPLRNNLFPSIWLQNHHQRAKNNNQCWMVVLRGVDCRDTERESCYINQ